MTTRRAKKKDKRIERKLIVNGIFETRCVFGVVLIVVAAAAVARFTSFALCVTNICGTGDIYSSSKL